MILYHTSDREIRKPDIHIGRKNADFGWGFYLTPDREFTYRWARENAVVNEYKLDEAGLQIHRFSRDTDWFQYIFHNRRLQDGIFADVIIGPIGIVIADSLLGEITPKMALAVGQSRAVRILIPMNKCDNLVAGIPQTSTAALIGDVMAKLKGIIHLQNA